MKGGHLLRRNIAELLGTFAIVFSGCGAVMVASRFPGVMPPMGVPIIFGIVVTIMIYSLGHLSGAHFNPAVTLAFALIKKFSWSEVPFYLISQVLGAFLAIILLKFMLPMGEAFGATFPSGITPYQAFAWEFLMTFFLMFVVMGVATDSRAQGVMAGLAIGATVTLNALVGGPITGASMNPARSFAPNFFEGRMDVLWIYWTAPFLGAVAAAFLYEWMKDITQLEPQTAEG